MRRCLVVAVLPALLLPAATAASPVPDPTFLPTALQQYPKARERGLDQLAHPGFQGPLVTGGPAELDQGFDTDPYRRGWAGTRGTEVPDWFINRYGARLAGTLYAPPGRGRHPGVILLTGGNGREVGQQEFAHGLAEAGYLVLGLSAQGDYGSEAAPRDPVPSTPENEFCKPWNFRGWQDPQEMGIREHATCAGGYEPQAPPPDPAVMLASAATHYQEVVTERYDYRAYASFYDGVKARKTFAALDAAAWLRSDDNPLRDRLAPGKLGIAGFSLGAHGALLAGNGDPQRRFGAVVSWDGFGRIAPTTRPRVPTLFFQQEYDAGLPKRRAPDAAELPAYRDAALFRAAGVPAGVVVPDAATHQDFTFVNFPLVWPFLATLGLRPEYLPGFNSTRDGSRVALYYTQAWFDRALKGSDGAALRVRTFPRSADASAIGQGRFDPTTQANVPYTIGGESVAAKLSPLLPSFVPGCADLRKAC